MENQTFNNKIILIFHYTTLSWKLMLSNTVTKLRIQQMPLFPENDPCFQSYEFAFSVNAVWTALRSDLAPRSSSLLCGGCLYDDRTVWASVSSSRGSERGVIGSRQTVEIIRTDLCTVKASCPWELGGADLIFLTSSRLSNPWKVTEIPKMSILRHSSITVAGHAHPLWCFSIHCGR